MLGFRLDELLDEDRIVRHLDGQDDILTMSCVGKPRRLRLRSAGLDTKLRLAKIPDVLLQCHSGFRPHKGNHKTRGQFGIEHRTFALYLRLHHVSRRLGQLQSGMVRQRHLYRLFKAQHQRFLASPNYLAEQLEQQYQHEAIWFHLSSIHSAQDGKVCDNPAVWWLATRVATRQCIRYAKSLRQPG